ncbi:MAG TPA: DUF1761 domain-containing protein [Acidobacteriaceae bacterium]|nr:DUF1761 domain-containing protein [Acidobacteriaceae bacterium]
MLFLIWLVLCLVVVSLILLPPALWLREVYKRYSGWRVVACPENQQQASVSIDARHAAMTGLHGTPDLRLCDCTRWPERLKCGRACLPHAIDAEASTPGEVKVKTKQIYHLPIVLAGFAAWCVGAIWHSQYLFRTRWMNAAGLTHAQVKQIGWQLAPHVLTLAICLLFAYGVAWLLAVWHRKGVLQGVLMSALLAGAVAAASWYGIAKLPRDLLLIEAGYIVLATLIVGAIVGGLYDRLVLRSQ